MTILLAKTNTRLKRETKLGSKFCKLRGFGQYNNTKLEALFWECFLVFKKVSKNLLAIISLIALLGLLSSETTHSGAQDNVQGGAWSENIGWVSFNCDSSHLTAPRCTTDYGVHINDDGTFSGAAWSEIIGWIDFAPSGPYPSSPDHSVKVDLQTGELSGWARAMNQGGGWDGWIKMRGTNYGVSIDFNTGEFSGAAWSDTVIGWLNFNCSNQGVCATSNYKVTTTFSPAPRITNLTNSFPSPCSQSRIPTFTWETDAQLPYDYEIRFCTNPDCTGGPIFSELKETTSSMSWAPACSFACGILPYSNVSFGGTYYGQIRARNTGGTWSGWSTSGFTTYNNAYPFPDFLCDGTDCSGMEIDENVVFSITNNSTTYDGLLSCSWTLADIVQVAEGNPQSDCELRVYFTAPPPGQRLQNITMTVTDTNNYSCSATKTLEIRFPLPEYREVAPR